MTSSPFEVPYPAPTAALAPTLAVALALALAPSRSRVQTVPIRTALALPPKLVLISLALVEAPAFRAGASPLALALLPLFDVDLPLFEGPSLLLNHVL